MFYCCSKRHLLAVWIVAALVPLIVLTKKSYQSIVKTEESTTETQSETQKISPVVKIPSRPRNIKIKNSITHKMLGYKHFFGTFNPTKFSVTVNGKTIEPDSSDTVYINGDKLQVRYYYEFMNGKRRGAKLIEYDVDPKVSELEMSFEWKDDWRIKMDGTTPLSATEIPLEGKTKEGKAKTKKNN